MRATARPVRTIAVVGPKGGTGKSVVATNLAVALERLAPGVVLFDADLAQGNVAALLGLPPSSALLDVLAERRSLASTIEAGPEGIGVIAAADGVLELSRLSQIDHAGLVALFSDPGVAADSLLVDTPSGLSDTALGYAAATRDVIVVVTDEPGSLHDAATLVRHLTERFRARRFHVVTNRVENTRHGRDLHRSLLARIESMLDPVNEPIVEHVGSIPNDARVPDAARAGRPVVDLHPRSAAALAFVKLAARVARWPRPATPAGRIEFFVERLIQAADSHSMSSRDHTSVRATA